MKKIKIILILFISIFAFKINVFAASASLSVSSSSVYVGDNFTVSVKVNSAAAWNVHVKSSGPVQNCSIKQADATDDAMDTNKTFSATCTTTGEGTISISLSGDVTSASDGEAVEVSGTKTIKVSGKTAAQPSTPQPSTPKPNNSQTSKPSNNKPQNNLSTNNSVKDINIEGCELVKVDNNNYTLTVSNNVTSVNVNASAEDSKATVTGTGARELQVGENNVEVIITSESGAENKINIKITRKDGFYLNDLKEALNASDEVSIVINAGDKIAKENLQTIKDSKKKVLFNYYDADKKLLYSFSIDGNKINDIEEINSNLTFTSDNIDKIQTLANYADGMYLNFEHKNSFPNDTKVKVFVGDKFENQSIVNIYQYDNEKLIYASKDIEVKDGYIEFEIKQGAEYLVTRANIAGIEDNASNTFLIVSIVELLIIIGLVVVDYMNINPINKLRNKTSD